MGEDCVGWGEGARKARGRKRRRAHLPREITLKDVDKRSTPALSRLSATGSSSTTRMVPDRPPQRRRHRVAHIRAGLSATVPRSCGQGCPAKALSAARRCRTASVDGATPRSEFCMRVHTTSFHSSTAFIAARIGGESCGSGAALTAAISSKSAARNRSSTILCAAASGIEGHRRRWPMSRRNRTAGSTSYPPSTYTDNRDFRNSAVNSHALARDFAAALARLSSPRVPASARVSSAFCRSRSPTASMAEARRYQSSHPVCRTHRETRQVWA